MSRIEMSLSEYNTLKDKIKALEGALNYVSKEASLFKGKVNDIQSLVIDLKNASFMERVFHWKDVTKPFNKFLNKKKNAEIHKD